MKKSVFVSVPASSGNLGPGFDVLGAALQLRNDLRVHVDAAQRERVRVIVKGEGASALPVDDRNAVVKGIYFVFRRSRVSPPKLRVECVNRIPLARGLGSSSAAYLSGLLAGNALLGNRFSKEEILGMATELEGHPDNVAPALFGGIRAAGWVHGKVASFAWPVPRLVAVAAIPEFHLATKKARAVLPKRVPMKDAVSNIAAVALMRDAFPSAPGLLADLLNDRLHEPFRARLVPGFHAVKKHALRRGALGVILSGAGPTMVAFAQPKRAPRIAEAMRQSFHREGVRCVAKILNFDRKGAIVR